MILTSRYLVDVDDYLDEQNDDNPNQLSYEELIADMADDILGDDMRTGDLLFEVKQGKTSLALYEEILRGVGYSSYDDAHTKTVDFQCRLGKMRFAYAENGDLFICYKPSYRYEFPSVAHAELIAYYIMNQVGIYKENEERRNEASREDS